MVFRIARRDSLLVSCDIFSPTSPARQLTGFFHCSATHVTATRCALVLFAPALQTERVILSCPEVLSWNTLDVPIFVTGRRVPRPQFFSSIWRVPGAHCLVAFSFCAYSSPKMPQMTLSTCMCRSLQVPPLPLVLLCEQRIVSSSPRFYKRRLSFSS